MEMLICHIIHSSNYNLKIVNAHNDQRSQFIIKKRVTEENLRKQEESVQKQEAMRKG